MNDTLQTGASAGTDQGAARPLLDIRDVVKRYGATLAVDHVSFALRPGEIVGFVGPNGAGKSTLLKLVSTYLEPDEGEIELAGHDVVKDPVAARAELGYLAEHNALFDGMRVVRYLEFVGRARGLSGGELAARLDWTIGACALQAVTKKRVHECSKGYRQRIGLAAALIHDPRVIALDEPTHGLDPVQMAAFRDFLRSLAPGRAILFSSHIVGEVCDTCERVVAIHKGRLVADLPVAELARRAKRDGRTLDGELLRLLEPAAAATPNEPRSGGAPR
ncbi:MAG: ABC transporter ATP-binding protein [Planctomycetes bacterium]|nr:ABC transporter ATP-binding protein [Planctomycetota bacterium]